MAIGPIHLAWLLQLARSTAFENLNSVIDIGPQDIQIERPVLEAAMSGMLSGDRMTPLLETIFGSGLAAHDAQKPFYELFGLSHYASVDLDDSRATFRRDLNKPLDGVPEFDVVTNFGTTEHVFNIGEAFKSIHELTRPGGVSLHSVPCFAFINHGFYTINPNLLVERARANRYEIVDFSYFDNAFVRNACLARTGIGTFDLATLPIRLEDMENTQVFMTKIVDLFYRNLTAEETRETIAALDPASRAAMGFNYPSQHYHICFVFDLIFFAMRRPRDRAAFVMPVQNPNGVTSLRASHV